MVARYVAGGVLVLVVVLGLMLAVRPLIFSVADPRDDTRVAILPQTELLAGPTVRQAVLVASHGLDGERTVDGNPIVWLSIAPLAGGSAAVVNASPAGGDDCHVAPAEDRLTGCGGSWTYEGDPIDPGLEPLQRFPVTLRDGAVYVDLTAPVRGRG